MVQCGVCVKGLGRMLVDRMGMAGMGYGLGI